MAFVRTRRVIDNPGSEAVIAAAEEAALKRGNRVFIAVVDVTGEAVALRRTAGAQIASARVAVDKARTSAIFAQPSRKIEEQVSRGRLGALALRGAAALTGGIPLKLDGEVVGAVATSGETPDQDEQVSLAGAAAAFSASDVRALTQYGARALAEAAGSVADQRGVAPVVAVVDADGELLFLRRPDAAHVASVGIATDKARTAAIYRRPSKDFEDQAAGGRPSVLHLARAVPLQGGMPVEYRGDVVGAIGVSGASSADEDNELAVLAARTFPSLADAASGGNGANYFDPQTVREKFATGGLLLDTDRYKIDAGRRQTPGEAEYHEHWVDVMHVIQGEAKVITGGEMVDAREVGPGELKAGEVRGGRSHHLREGAVLAVPEGVPHQFVEVSDPFLYFVVKVET